MEGVAANGAIFTNGCASHQFIILTGRHFGGQLSDVGSVTAVSVSRHAHRKQSDLAACINYRARHMLANRRKQTSGNLSQSTTLSRLVEDREGTVTDQLWLLGCRMLHDPALTTSNVDVNFVLGVLHRVDGGDVADVSGVPNTYILGAEDADSMYQRNVHNIASIHEV
jgi:hypothetical protein